MFENKLKLNPDMTEFMLIGNQSQRRKFDSCFPISLLGNDFNPANVVRNLGVIFDADFSFKNHVSNVVKSCYYHMRDLRRVRKHLSRDTATSLANALVSSRLDYCNSLLYSLPKSSVQKLQLVQNTLARIVSCRSKFCSISPILRELHWLPVKSRIYFKANLLIYKALKYNSPKSLRNLLSTRSVDFNLRNVDSMSLCTLPACKGYGCRSFSYFSPLLWNPLPPEIRHSSSISTFRKHLKQYYFPHPP